MKCFIGGGIIIIEVIFDMARDEFLLSTAMLATLWEEKFNDSLDLLLGFVKYAIGQSTKIDCELDLKSIHATAKKYLYIPNIPEQIIEELLDRLTNKNYGKILFYDKMKQKYILRKDLSDFVSSFDNKLAKEKDEISCFFNGLESYYNSKARKTLTQDNLKGQFFHFLENEGFDFLRSSDKPINLREISTDNGQCYFLIAQYILSLYDNKTPEYATILRITMGYFLSKSIYLDSSKNHFKKNPPLKDLNVYIDTTLLLYILNCKTEYQYNSAMSMVNLLLDNGASLFYYPHNLEEVEVIIKKYKKDRSSPRRTLEKFDEEKYTDFQIEVFYKSIKSNLEKKHIFLSDTQSYSSYKNVIDEVGLAKYLTKKISGYKGNSNILDHDIKSISSICRERNGIKTEDYENLTCIWVTSNARLVKYTNKFFEKEYKNCFSPIISDRKLTTELWIKYGNSMNNVFESFLLENALLAIEPTDTVVSSFIETVNSFEKMNTITPEAAAHARIMCVNDKNLMLYTDGDPEKMTEQTTNDLLAAYRDSIIGEYKKEMDSKQKEYAEKEKAKDAELAIRNKENKEKDQEIAKLKNEIQETKSKKEESLKKVDLDSEKSTNTACKWIKRTVYSILIISGLACIFGFIWELVSFANGNGNTFLLIISIVIALTNMALLIIDLVGVAKQLLSIKEKIRFSIKSRYYKKYLDDYKKYNL